MHDSVGNADENKSDRKTNAIVIVFLYIFNYFSKIARLFVAVIRWWRWVLVPDVFALLVAGLLLQFAILLFVNVEIDFDSGHSSSGRRHSRSGFGFRFKPRLVHKQYSAVEVAPRIRTTPAEGLIQPSPLPPPTASPSGMDGYQAGRTESPVGANARGANIGFPAQSTPPAASGLPVRHRRAYQTYRD